MKGQGEKATEFFERKRKLGVADHKTIMKAVKCRERVIKELEKEGKNHED